MNAIIARVLILVCLVTCVPLSIAGEFKSRIISTSALMIVVAEHHFIRIRNFTQEGGAVRGVVSVTTNTGTANVLTATRIDIDASPSPSPSPTPSPVPLEPINSVVIAGPATITISPVPSATLFLTYKKDLDSD
jgi:hypothetical protein